MLESLPDTAPRAADAKNPPKPGNSKYSREVMVEILERVGRGTLLATVLRQMREDIGSQAPSYNTVLAWGNNSPAIAAALARAYEACAAHVGAEMLEIADRRPAGLDIDLDAIAKGQRLSPYQQAAWEMGLELEKAAVQRDKLRIHAREKMAAVIGGSKWAQKIQHSNDPDNPLTPKAKRLEDYTEEELLAALHASEVADPEAGEE